MRLDKVRTKGRANGLIYSSIYWWIHFLFPLGYVRTKPPQWCCDESLLHTSVLNENIYLFIATFNSWNIYGAGWLWKEGRRDRKNNKKKKKEQKRDFTETFMPRYWCKLMFRYSLKETWTVCTNRCHMKPHFHAFNRVRCSNKKQWTSPAHPDLAVNCWSIRNPTVAPSCRLSSKVGCWQNVKFCASVLKE